MGKFHKLRDELINGNAPKVSNIVRDLLDAGSEPHVIINDGLLTAMDIVGVKFKNNEFFVPQVLFAARAMHAGMDILKPLLVDENAVQSKGTVIIGTALGDQHDIGKNLVIMMLESAGYRVVNLGTDVTPDKFVHAAKAEKAQAIGISALMTTTMSGMPDVIKAFEKEGIRDNVKIIVGGAPLSNNYADEIGADGYGDDATDAVDLMSQLLST